MSTFKAVELLAVLSAAERKRLKQTFHLLPRGANPQMQKAIQLLCRPYPEKLPGRQTIASRLGKSEAQTADLMNKLWVSLQAFCLMEARATNSEPMDKERQVAGWLAKKGLPHLYNTELIESPKNNPASSWQHLSRFRYLKAFAVNEKVKHGRRLRISLQDLNRELDLFYCLEKLKLACELISRPNIKNDSYTIPLQLETLPPATGKLVDTYRLMYGALNKVADVELSLFNKLFALVKQLPANNYLLADRVTLCHYLLNISLYKFKAGDMAFRPAFLKVVDYMDKQHVLLENGLISPPLFKVIVSMALRDGRIARARKFFAAYHGFLPQEVKREVELFTRAQMAFHEKDYRQAQKYLNEVKKTALDPYYALNIRKLEIKILTEIYFRPNRRFNTAGEQDLLLAALRNFGLYLKRPPANKSRRSAAAEKTTISSRNMEGAVNFVRLLRHIITRANMIGERAELRSALKEMPQVAEREWLLSLV